MKEAREPQECRREGMLNPNAGCQMLALKRLG
jgi:hypothetical protein